MNNRSQNLGAIVSCAICAILVSIGVVRLLSYSLGPVGDVLRSSIVGFLCYDPDSLFSVQFFKLLATPTVVAGIYFFFRWRNSGRPTSPEAAQLRRAHRLDFESPLLRGVLTTLITLHWLAMEWWKFNTEGFYPWSPLESRWLNLGVLIASQALAFWSMKYLSFEPLNRDGA
ncbi:MAG: hypothetical protein JSW50_03395 [Candidatus Latescibacterota bacterium]|nr:MAG: hypothetical protein JSW50_03395 [Candidatus Latescibacterota bacterium]